MAAGLLAAAAAGAAPAPRIETWRLEGGRVVADGVGADTALPVGSLLKPFLAQAWASAHPDRATPRFDCDGRRCWLRSGHGTVGMARALAVSCNAYFLALAQETPQARMAATLAAAGFEVQGVVTPAAAVGLNDTVSVSPRRLLDAYVHLTRTPWPEGERVRREVLAGLRRAALDGTAQGLGRRGYWAKTGTVDAPGRAGLQTAGWALAVDDAGWAIVGRLEPGTGRDAARALAPLLQRRHHTGAASGNTAATVPSVRVLLFEVVRPRALRAVNRGPAPVATATGFVGPGGSVALKPGDRLAESLWEVALPDRRLVRRVNAALEVEAGAGGRLALVASMDGREYVSGVIAAELAGGDAARRRALGAAVLRFRAEGARHSLADACDSTHCAWFIGRGPRVRWPEPRRALLDGPPLAPLGTDEWAAIVAEARAPGPASWTSHCGGRPLSRHAVWGGGDDRVVACPLHDASSARPWARTWTDAPLARAFGRAVSRLEVAPEDGVYRIAVTTAAGREGLLYDEAHRRLAAELGWGAMPSPPDRIVRTAGGFRAEGVGLGHRVGLCLGERR
jgi:stage II sporulation protein D